MSRVQTSTVANATLRVNTDTWDNESFATLQRKQTSSEASRLWARLVSTNPNYPNVDVFNDEVTFGRREDADVRVSDAAISFTHCRLWRVVEQQDSMETKAEEEMVS
jgi:hypothetical protein